MAYKYFFQLIIPSLLKTIIRWHPTGFHNKDMPSKRNISSPPLKILFASAILLILYGAFGLYVYSEKEIDRANERRQISFQLAGKLRQSSDDLTRMVRTYVITGDPRFKKYYQLILDIRNGKIPEPEGYALPYWDLVVAGNRPQPIETGNGVALLDQMRREGFTNEEFNKLASAKQYSDELTEMEFEAMRMVDSEYTNSSAKREQARQMLHGESYHQAKLKIMEPIKEFYILMDERTLAAVNHQIYIAYLTRLLFILASVWVIFGLWRIYNSLHKILGGSATEIHEQLDRIGQGDLSAAILVKPGTEDSVLAGLFRMQQKLISFELERKQSEAKIRGLAFHDSLTNLPNRRLLDDRLEQAIAASKRSGLFGAVLFLDLDNFKPLNDTHGHKAGDLLLIEVARRLESCVRKVDTVARFGGDEFVIVVSELDDNETEGKEQAYNLAEKVRLALAGTYLLGSNITGTSKMIVHHNIEVSIGVALFNNNSSPEMVLKYADKAMYKAKEAGRNTICFYE